MEIFVTKKSTIETLGIPQEFGSMLLAVSLILLLMPYFFGRDFGVVKIPDCNARLRSRLKILGPIFLILCVTLFVRIWSPSLSQSDYLKAPELLDSTNANRRLAAVQFLGSAASNSVRYHWLMLEQLPAAIRQWAGHVENDTSVPEPLGGTQLLYKRSVARSNQMEVRKALWTLSGRNLENEVVKTIPRQYAVRDSFSNYDIITYDSMFFLTHIRKPGKVFYPSNEKKAQLLEQSHNAIREFCTKWYGEEPRALSQIPDAIGTKLPDQRNKRWIDLSLIDLSLAVLTDIELPGVNFDGTRLCWAKLDHARLNKASFEDVNFYAANLWDAKLREAWMERVNCSHADLGNSDLTDSWLLGADLRWADLWHSNLNGAFLMGADLSNLQTMSGCSARGINLWKARLINASLGDPVHKQLVSEARSIKFRSSGISKDLGKIKEKLKELEDNKKQEIVDLQGAYLREANLSNAYLWNVRLDGADLSEAILERTNLIGVDLSGVTGLTPKQIEAAIIDESTILPRYFPDSVKHRIYSRFKSDRGVADE